jgi:endonuclease-8
VVIDVGLRVFVCFRPLQVEFLRKGGLRHRDLVMSLGPDLLAQDIEFSTILMRARQLVDPATPIADVLLDQRVACGMGNVYKSEVLFLHGCNPQRLIGHCEAPLVEQLYRTAQRLLLRNTGGGPRITRGTGGNDSGLWVYGRSGLPCLRCRLPIVSQRLGRNRRSTFWCAHCQPAATAQPS